jgi:hypothetical protein
VSARHRSRASSPQRRRLRRTVILGATSAIAVITVSVGVSLTGAPASGVTQIVVAAFTGPSNGITEATNNHWSVSGNTGATDASLPAMVDGPDSGTDVDRLRLTNTGQGQTGYALYDVAQTTSAGLDINFNVALHGAGGTGCPANPTDNYNATSSGLANSGNTCQADGFVFYLKDGSNTDTGGSSVGWAGGSLGYGAVSGNNGLSGALLGIGLDAYGNFYQAPFGSSSGCPSDPTQSTSQFARRSLIVRGPQGSSRTDGYCRITTDSDRTASSRNIGVDISNSGIFSQTGAAVRVTIDINDTSGSRTNGTGKVYVAAAGTSNWSTVSPTATFELPQKLHDAATFKFGFVAGTGGGAMNSEIWSTSVSSIRDIPDPTWVTSANQCLQQSQAVSLQLAGTEGVQPYSFDVTSGALPTGLSMTTAGLISGTPTTLGSSTTTIRLTDSTAPTARSVSRTFTFTTQAAACSIAVTWSINGTTAAAPASASNDGSCTSGTYSQSTVDGYRVAVFTAPASGNGSCTWTPPTGVTTVQVLAVGGGGGGGSEAGAGGGGGAQVYHSSVQVSASATITVGAGGSGGTVTTGGADPTGLKRGTDGSSSSFIDGTNTLTANGGKGGGGCNWSNSRCLNSGVGNSGAAGGTVAANTDTTLKQPSGTQNHAGGAGGNGVYTNSSNLAANPAGNGADGFSWRVPGSRTTFGGGGAGGGQVRTGGAGGGASSVMAATPSAATASTGGGGAGGDGGRVAGAGGSGVVYVRYAVTTATNLIAPSIDLTTTSNGSLSTTPAAKRQWATLSGSTCGSTWTTEATRITSWPNSDGLARGRCYRWTVDAGLVSGATVPVDSTSSSASTDLTSPVLIVAPAVTLTAPTVIPVDPRLAYVDLTQLTITSDASVQLCFYESSATTLSGVGSPASGSSVRFDAATRGSTDSASSGTTISGDRSATLTLSGTRSATETTAATIRASLASGVFSSSKYLLVRSVPVLDNQTSTCDSSGASLTPVDENVRLIQLKPLDLGTVNNGVIRVG